MKEQKYKKSVYFCRVMNRLQKIILPNCKSIVIRQLVAHYVATGDVLPVGDDECSDVLVTRQALLDIQQRKPVIDVRDCGAACRFLLALLAVQDGTWKLTGMPRLLKRPVDGLLQTLTGLGANIAAQDDGWLIQGRPLQAETLRVDCTHSSQFASALLLIAPKIGLKTLHLLPETVPSADYVRLTLNCLSYPVDVPELSWRREPVGRLGDWSAALFWYAYAALHPDARLELQNLTLRSAQGDSAVAEWLADLGVLSEETEDGVLIHRASDWPECMPVRPFDVLNHPDVVPVMAALACLLPADFTFLHTENLKYKESDRLSLLADQLKPFAEIAQSEGTLRIIGRPHACDKPRIFQTHNDHRLAMAFLLFGPDTVIDDISCLRKSYPGLVDEMKKLNA